MNWITWSLMSAIFAGATAILAKQGVTNVNSNLATAVRTTVILVVAWGIALASVPASSVFQIGRKSLVFLVLSGLATGLSWLCYFRALQLGEASRVAPLDKLSVVFVIIFAALFLGEKLTPWSFAGGALIALGAVLLAVK
jgi:transporter family protein